MMLESTPLAPGATIGILGGGQLGRMAILAGRPLGYRFHVYDPGPGACAAPLAEKHHCAPWERQEALDGFIDAVDVVTFEFENVTAASAAYLAERVPVFPRPEVLATCQNRIREKEFCRANGLPCAPFAVASDVQELLPALEKVGFPCVVKTATSGYDGKGQIRLETMPGDYSEVWENLGGVPVVVEKWIQHAGEYSVVCARGRDGSSTAFPVPENVHRNHILHTSTVPCGLEESRQKEARALALRAVAAMKVVGLLTVELFLSRDGTWLINEFAPRPHNSGHYTIDACATSQFEQLVRAVAGLPLGDTRLLHAATMVNLLGDVWLDAPGGQPDWASLLREPDVHLHLYDKGEARPARKMGHFTVTGEDAASARRRAESLFARL